MSKFNLFLLLSILFIPNLVKADGVPTSYSDYAWTHDSTHFYFFFGILILILSVINGVSIVRWLIKIKRK